MEEIVKLRNLSMWQISKARGRTEMESKARPIRPSKPAMMKAIPGSAVTSAKICPKMKFSK